MHTEYALAHYHDGTGEKAAGWHVHASAISSDHDAVMRHLKCAQISVRSKQKIGSCLDQKEIRVVSRQVTDWHAECGPVKIVDHGYIRKDDLPNPDLQAAAGTEQARQVMEGTRDFLHRQAQARNAAAQQDPGDICPHCGGPVHYVTSHRGRLIPVCDRCGYLIRRRTACDGTRHGNTGLLCFVAAVAVVCILSCVVCTAMVCKAMNDVRQLETQQER